MSLVVVENAGLEFGGRSLVSALGLRVGEEDRIGVVGRNGSGKSALLKIIAGVSEATAGLVRRSRAVRIGYLPQEIEVKGGKPLLDMVLGSVPGRTALEDMLAEVEGELEPATEPDEQIALAQKLADLHEDLGHFETSYSRHEALRILVGLGFSQADMGRGLPGGAHRAAARVKDFDADAVVALVELAAREELLPRFRALAQHQVFSKATKEDPTDVVTEADLALEARLGPELEALLPGSVVMGEEAVAKDPSRLELLAGERPVWVLDPLDGTRNFAKGVEEFGVLLALIERGRARWGFLHQPLQARTFVAEQGAGAMLLSSSLGGRRVTRSVDSGMQIAPGVIQLVSHSRLSLLSALQSLRIP